MVITMSLNRSCRQAGETPSTPGSLTCIKVPSPEASRLLLQAGTSRVVTANTVPHATNAIDVTALLAEAVGQMIEEMAAHSPG